MDASLQVRDLKFHEGAQSFFWDWLCDSTLVTRTRNGRAFFYDTPWLGTSVTVGALAALYTHTNRDWNLVYENPDMVNSAHPASALMCCRIVSMPCWLPLPRQ